jgi:hypothetical protein
MSLRKDVLIIAVVLVVVLVSFSSCMTGQANQNTQPIRVDFGMKNDNQNKESMKAHFGLSLNPYNRANKFAFGCTYGGSRMPDTLLLRIDNGSVITLKVSYANTFSRGMMEFAVSDDVVQQLLNCNDRIDLEFTAANPPSEYVRKFEITSPLGIKNVINSN